jgi:hypothetical protein
VSASGPSSPITVAPLENGTAYTFTVTATNAVGTSAASASTDPVRVAGVPDAPTITGVHIPGGSGTAHVTFTQPDSNGSLITSYTVTPSPSGTPVTGPGELQENGDRTITVPGLTNGTTYTFTVRATNGVGTGPASAPSDPVTPAGVPGAPTQVSAVGGNGEATVSFVAPSANGSPITNYTVTSDPEGVTATGDGSPIVVDELTNGTAYQFTVTATNGVGTGPASAVSNSVIPAGVPDAPTSVFAVAGNGSATVYVYPPEDDNGAPITSYTVTPSPSGTPVSGPGIPQEGGSFRFEVTGLTNGTSYTFTAAATNAEGTGPASAPSDPVTPAAVPDAPVLQSVLPQNGAVKVTFSVPDANGSPITSYTATPSSGTPVSGLGTADGGFRYLIVPVTNGFVYTFTVTASNAVGTSGPSAESAPVWPGPPAAPVNVVATVIDPDSVSVSFSPDNKPQQNSTFQYEVTVSGGGVDPVAGASSPIVVNGLTTGAQYTFTVRAKNVFGFSVPSSASNQVTMPTVPGAPTNVVATAGNGVIDVNFDPPASDGGSPITTYTVTANPSGTTASTNSTNIQVWVPNGTEYTVTVTATNAVGTGPASEPSNAVTPAGHASQPQNVTAVAGNGEATVSFSGPASNGGSPVHEYTATSSPGGITKTGSSSPLVVTGLTNGVTYTFTVTATNGAGTGLPSDPSNQVTPGPPAPPTNVTAYSEYYGTEVSWTHADLPGQKPTFKYKVTSSSGEVEYTTESSVSFGCLDEGSHTFTVQAKNVFGYSAASAPSNEVTTEGCSHFSVLAAFLTDFGPISDGPAAPDSDAPDGTGTPTETEPPSTTTPPTTTPPEETPPEGEETPPTTEPPVAELPAEEAPPPDPPPSEAPPADPPPATEPSGVPVLF